MKTVSVILPALNEKDNLLALIPAIHKALKGVPHDIWIIDDQSADGSAQAVARLGDPLVHFYVRADDHGYAQSLRFGIERSTGQHLVLMDADFNHDPCYLPALINRLDAYDCVSGSRFIRGGKMTPWWRDIMSRAFNLFVRIMTGSRISDNLFGFFAVKREVLMACPVGDIFFGFGDYGMRLLYHLQKNKARILEWPAVYQPRRSGYSHAHLARLFLDYTRATLALMRRGRLS